LSDTHHDKVYRLSGQIHTSTNYLARTTRLERYLPREFCSHLFVGSGSVALRSKRLATSIKAFWRRENAPPAQRLAIWPPSSIRSSVAASPAHSMAGCARLRHRPVQKSSENHQDHVIYTSCQFQRFPRSPHPARLSAHRSLGTNRPSRKPEGRLGTHQSVRKRAAQRPGSFDANT
jgi:hypothetical protein